MAHMNAARKGAPRSSWVQLAHARFLAVTGDRRGAKTVVTSLLDDDPQDGPAWSLLGSLYSADRDYAAADAAYTKAMALKQGKGIEAERLVRPIVETYTDDSEAQDLLAHSLVQQRGFEQAADLFENIAWVQARNAAAKRVGMVLASSGSDRPAPFFGTRTLATKSGSRKRFAVARGTGQSDCDGTSRRVGSTLSQRDEAKVRVEASGRSRR